MKIIHSIRITSYENYGLARIGTVHILDVIVGYKVRPVGGRLLFADNEQQVSDYVGQLVTVIGYFMRRQQVPGGVYIDADIVWP